MQRYKLIYKYSPIQMQNTGENKYTGDSRVQVPKVY